MSSCVGCDHRDGCMHSARAQTDTCNTAATRRPHSNGGNAVHSCCDVL